MRVFFLLVSFMRVECNLLLLIDKRVLINYINARFYITKVLWWYEKQVNIITCSI